MYPISNDLLTRFQNGDKQYVRMTIGDTVLDGSDIMQGSFTINRFVETDESITIGSVVAAELACVLNNYEGQFNDFEFVGSEAYVEVGVEDGNHTVQYIPMGYFIFDEANWGRNTISLTALDRMMLFEATIDATGITFPITVTNLLSAICTKTGVTFGNTTALYNGDYVVAAMPDAAQTYRDLLKWICEISGNNGYISYDGKLYLAWFNGATQFNINTTNRTQSDIDRGEFLITGVSIFEGDSEFAAGVTSRPIKIKDNPLITNQEQTLANSLYQKLGGYQYNPFSATMLPSPHIYPMDCATFVTREGDNVLVSVTEVTFKLNGNTTIAGRGGKTVYDRGYGLADAILSASNIKEGTLPTGRIADGGITGEKIAALAVTEGKLAANAVTEGKIAANAVVADKIASEAVTTDKLAALAVTAGKIDAGAVTADKIDTGAVTVTKLSQDAQFKTLNSNNIGGRNLIAGTSQSLTAYTITGGSGYATMITKSITQVTGVTSYVFSFTAYASANNIRLRIYWKDPNNDVSVRVNNGASTSVASNGQVEISLTTTETRYCVAWTQSAAGTSSKTLQIDVQKTTGTSRTVTIGALQMEAGETPTAWSPSPDDNAKNVQQVFYRSASSTAPTYSTTWVTQTGTVNETWTRKHMEYSEDYPYLWTCTQTRNLSGNVTNSTVLLDDTITVIDGGKIITGSVTANQIATGTITADRFAPSVDMATNASVAATYAAKTEAVMQEQRVYYRSNSSTAPTASSTWVTSTATANATWTTKRMEYDPDYPYLWTCIQMKTVSGTITNSTVLLDDTTTVIDGGNIITGSIAANKVDVNGDLSSFNANIGGWAISTNAITKTVSNKTIELNSQTPSITAQSGNHIAGFTGGAEIFTSYEDTTNDYGTSSLKGNVFEQENKVWEEHATWSDWVTKSKTKITDGELFQTSILPDSSGYYSTGTTYVSRLDGRHLWFENGETDVRPNYVTVTDGTNYNSIYKDRVDINATTGTSPNHTTDRLLLYGQFISSERKVYVNSAVSEQYKATHSAGSFSVAEGGVTKSSLNALGITVNDASGNEASVLKKNALKVNTHDLLRMSPHFAQMFATEIPANANLNTTTYLKVGQYYCTTTYGFTNSPTGNQFVMEVTAMIYNRYDDESETDAAYRVRKITDYIGNQFIQYCSKPTNGSWSYGTWKKIITGADSITELTDTGNITTSTSMAYTGKSLTLPSAGWWAIEGYANYSNSAPIAIAINREVGSYYYELAYAERHGYDKTVQYLRTSCVGYYDANSVIKLFARYSGANSNGVGLTAKKLH